jgi:hypothetical protein
VPAGTVPAHRFHRHGQDAVRVAGSHPDAHAPDIDAEASAASGPASRPPSRVLGGVAGPIGQAVRYWVHSADPRYHGDLGAHSVERRVDAGRIFS